jgi:hypothetical protein
MDRPELMSLASALAYEFETAPIFILGATGPALRLDILCLIHDQENALPPKVFVSHASEDKARFVIPFATALLGKGIDAWVDQWEMLPGDSLVDKIFEEGLKGATAVVIVVSSVSVSKPWVREELNASVVARISKGTKIIPIVLDGCEVPEALRATVWENVPDPGNFNWNRRVRSANQTQAQQLISGRRKSGVMAAKLRRCGVRV